MDYKINYSKRKTIGLRIKSGELFISAPIGTSDLAIKRVLESHLGWIEKNLEKSKARCERFPELSALEISQMKKDAKKYFVEKTEEYAKNMNLKYGRITITSAKTRFGSCSQKKNICFSYRLMRYPEAAREYVIVHELSHLVHMNHSPQFYKYLAQFMPDYKERRRLLK